MDDLQPKIIFFKEFYMVNRTVVFNYDHILINQNKFQDGVGLRGISSEKWDFTKPFLHQLIFVGTEIPLIISKFGMIDIHWVLVKYDGCI